MLADLLFYNMILLAGVAFAGALFTGRGRMALGVAAALALLAPMLAWELGGEMFGRMRLVAHAVFLHVPLGLMLAAVAYRRRRPRTALGFGACAALVVAVGVDAFLVEPHWLEVSHVAIRSARVASRVRIVVLADIQTDAVGEYERMVLARAAAESPDLVLLPGDYVHTSVERADEVRRALADAIRASGLTARLGIYAVQGNVDRPGWERVFEGLPVQVFPETAEVDAGPVHITALSLDDSFDRMLSVPASDRFHVVFGHAPDFALGAVQADLLAAGHTHGGQVRLLGLPLVTLSHVPRRWAAGVTRLAGDRTLVVSRGLGMERGRAPRLRFGCRPELVVIDVEPESPRVR